MDVVPVSSPFPQDDSLHFVGSYSSWAPGLYNTDAGGGEFSAFPRLRRVGVGIVRLEWGDGPLPVLALAAWGAIVGNIQTVVRGELLAILQVLRNVCVGHFVVRTDSEVNQLLFLKMLADPIAFSPDSNKDLWDEVRLKHAAFVSAGVSFMVEWIKGHATGTHIAKGLMESADVWGNYAADALAVHAAEHYEVLLSDSLSYTWFLNATRRVQARLVAISKEFGKDWQ